jgi:hypothetical protein
MIWRRRMFVRLPLAAPKTLPYLDDLDGCRISHAGRAALF